MRPVIAELLRTCVLQPIEVRIERIVHQEVTSEGRDGKSRRARTARIYLSDDELVIQALLTSDLGIDLLEGDVLKLHKFSVQKARRCNAPGHVAYLAIQACDVISRAESSVTGTPEEEAGGFVRDESASTFTAPPTSAGHSSLKRSDQEDDSLPPPSKQPRLDFESSSESEEEVSSAAEEETMATPTASQLSDDFETVSPKIHTTQSRRRVLRQIDSNASPYFKPTPNKKPQIKDAVPPPSPSPAPVSSPSPPIDAPVITPLANLPSIPPSTPVTILAAISWTGTALLRPSQAFPPKRHVKLHDISIGSLFSGVSLACYIDAADFKPERGTVALLQDVVVQRCGSGSGEVNECFMLNAYANLPAKLLEKGVESKWYVDDEEELEGMGLEAEVDELREWWDQREVKRSGVATQSTQGRRVGL